MSDPVSVLSYAANLCWSVWRLAKAVGNFNYHLVSTLFRLAREAWSAACVFATALANASCDILSYFYEVLVEFACLVSVLCRIVAQLVVVLVQVLSCLLAALQHVAVVVAELLFSGLQWTCGAIARGLQTLAASTEGLKHTLLCGVYSCGRFLSSTLCDVAYFVHSSALEVANHLSLAILTCSDYVLDRSQYVYERLAGAILDIAGRLVTVCSNSWCYVQNAVDAYLSLHDACLTVALIVMVISSLRILVVMFRKYGLTVPFFGQFSLPPPESMSRTAVPWNHMTDDLIFVSDEEDESAEDFSEESDESEENSNGTETISDVESFADEFEIVDDSDFESGDENDQNVINIQLTSSSTRYGLRERASCSPARSFSKLTQGDLRRYLENERDKRLCVVCQDNPKNVLLLPCKHMCMCVTCAHEIATSPNYSRRICPLCRSRINTVMDVFV